MADQVEQTPEWVPAGGTVETRWFQCEIVEDAAAADGGDLPRLQLTQNARGHQRLFIRVPSAQIDAVRKELFDRGYRGGLACCSSRSFYGKWRGFLNELEVAHIVVEMLGWQLSADEQALLDSIDDYGRGAPTGISSPRLRPAE